MNRFAIASESGEENCDGRLGHVLPRPGLKYHLALRCATDKAATDKHPRACLKRFNAGVLAASAPNPRLAADTELSMSQFPLTRKPLTDFLKRSGCVMTTARHRCDVAVSFVLRG